MRSGLIEYVAKRDQKSFWMNLEMSTKDILQSLHSFYAFVIHSRTSYTGCTDMPPFDPFRYPALEASIHSCKYITLMGILLSIHSRISYTGCTDMPPFDPI